MQRCIFEKTKKDAFITIQKDDLHFIKYYAVNQSLRLNCCGFFL